MVDMVAADTGLEQLGSEGDGGDGADASVLAGVPGGVLVSPGEKDLIVRD